MERLSLEAFKAQANEEHTRELENLTGGAMQKCHTADAEPALPG